MLLVIAETTSILLLSCLSQLEESWIFLLPLSKPFPVLANACCNERSTMAHLPQVRDCFSLCPGAQNHWGQFSWRDSSCHVGYRRESRLVSRLLWPNDEFCSCQSLQACDSSGTRAVGGHRLGEPRSRVRRWGRPCRSSVCDGAWGITLRLHLSFWRLSAPFC